MKRFVVVYASEDSFNTVDSLLIDASDSCAVEHCLRSALEANGLEKEDVSDIIVEHRYFISSCDGEADYTAK